MNLVGDSKKEIGKQLPSLGRSDQDGLTLLRFLDKHKENRQPKRFSLTI
jgi:hypothetical protein